MNIWVLFDIVICIFALIKARVSHDWVHNKRKEITVYLSNCKWGGGDLLHLSRSDLKQKYYPSLDLWSKGPVFDPLSTVQNLFLGQSIYTPHFLTQLTCKHCVSCPLTNCKRLTDCLSLLIYVKCRCWSESPCKVPCEFGYIVLYKNTR